MQQLTPQTSTAVIGLGRLIGAHAVLTQELSALLVEQHGLTLSELEVLVFLSRAPEQAMRRIDLSREARLSPSGITRMLDRMEATGLVTKRACKEDARVSYAVLTEAGMGKLRAAWPDHCAATERLLGERFDSGELATLADLLDRISGPVECEVGE
jgi:DNA-binding MarR family transcriptional regulator